MHRFDAAGPSFVPTVRRPVSARDTAWARSLALLLARRGIRPNAVSAAGAAANALAAAALLLAGATSGVPAAAWYGAAAALIGVRALCSLLDGMVAIEGRRSSRAGAVWNELPDRLSDPVLLVSAGSTIPDAPWGTTLGLVAAILAVVVAYVRVLGGALGVPQSFVGPMAKQHRLAAIAGGCLVAAVEAGADRAPTAMAAALAVVIVGCGITLVRRTRGLLRAIAPPPPEPDR